MNEQYTQQLEEKLQKLIALLTDQNLWNFLSDSERQVVSEVLNQN
jgi:ribonucleotide reductase beta subunit family protein with ferritin-like domain